MSKRVWQDIILKQLWGFEVREEGREGEKKKKEREKEEEDESGKVKHAT